MTTDWLAKKKLLTPRIPLDLMKMDLMGHLVSKEKYVSLGFKGKFLKIYQPDNEGIVSFIIFHTKMANGYLAKIVKSTDLDLSRGHLFFVQFHIDEFDRFESDYNNQTRRPLIILNPTIDDIFDLPIYSAKSFRNMIKYNETFGYLKCKKPTLDSWSQRLIECSNHQSYKYNLRTFINYFQDEVSHRRLVYLNESRFKYSWNKGFKVGQWNGSMDSLAKFTYTYSKEQLTAFWDSRFLDLIDF